MKLGASCRWKADTRHCDSTMADAILGRVLRGSAAGCRLMSHMAFGGVNLRAELAHQVPIHRCTSSWCV